MSEMKVLPLLWTPNEQEANPELHRLARLFADENLSNVPDFKKYWRVWVLTEVEKDALIQPWGVMALRQEIDVPLFHMRQPEQNREAIARFAQGYEALASRGRTYLNDQGFGGQSIFVHVSDESQNATMVKYLSRRLGLRPSNRMMMEV